MPATITAFMDDEVRDFFGSADTNDQAIAIIDLARLPPTKVSVIAAAPKNRQYSDHDGLDPVGTSMKCRLKIRFLNEP